MARTGGVLNHHHCSNEEQNKEPNLVLFRYRLLFVHKVNLLIGVNI